MDARVCVANEQTHTGEYRPIRDYVGLWAHVGSGIHKKAIRDDAGPWAYFDARWGRMEPTSDRRHGRWRRPTTYTQVAPMMARRPDNTSDTCNRTLLIYFIAASFYIPKVLLRRTTATPRLVGGDGKSVARGWRYSADSAKRFLSPA